MWKHIDGFGDRYKIYSDGRVYSEYKHGFLVQYPNEKGYLRVALHLDGRQRQFRVSRLVALAFLPNPNGYSTVNHRDGDKTNNDVSNLEWLSNRDNIVHGYKNGFFPRGEDRPGAKLTMADVLEIRRIYSSGEIGYRLLAKRFGVNRSTIRRIIKREMWDHV